MKSFQFVLMLSVAVVSAQTPASKAKPAAAAKTGSAATSKPAATAKPAAAKQTAAPATPKPAGGVQQGLGGPKPNDPDRVVISVDGHRITAREFESFIAALPEQYQMQARGPMKRQVADQIGRVKALAGEARKQGLDKDKMFQSKLQFQTENMLAAELYGNLVKSAPLSEGDMQRYFTEHKSEFEQAQARHILIRFKGSPVPLKEGQKELTEEEALAKATEIRKKIEGGEDFAALAKVESDDAGSGANGGDLGSFRRGSMVPAFEQAVFGLKPGEMSQPVKTQFGYHVIRLEKITGTDFAELRPELEKRLKPEYAKREMERIGKEAKIELDDDYFGADPQPAAKSATPAQPGQPQTK